MPLNIFDFDSINMVAQRKCARRYQRIEQRFNRPDIETEIGQVWQGIKADPATLENLRRVVPDQVKRMEVKYGEG